MPVLMCVTAWLSLEAIHPAKETGRRGTGPGRARCLVAPGAGRFWTQEVEWEQPGAGEFQFCKVGGFWKWMVVPRAQCECAHLTVDKVGVLLGFYLS